jgi:hypothetical protein
MLVEHHGQHAVVGRHELVIAGVGGDAPARGADARIDHREEHGAGRKVAIRSGQFEGAGEHVVRGNLVRDINERRVRANRQRDPLHRAGIVIARPEVGQQGDDGPRHASIVLQNCTMAGRQD